MNLTKEQKLEAVKHALRLIKSDNQEFMCIAFKHAILKLDPFQDWLDTESVFRYIPEFLKYKPEGVAKHHAWFIYSNGTPEHKAAKQSRIKILKDLLKELSI